MKNLMLSLIVTVCFVSVSMAQDVEKKEVKETITKEVEKCDPNCTKACCADKKAENHADCKDHKHGEAESKKCDPNCTKECCAKKEKKHENCDMKKHEGEAKKCEPGCTKACCADKKVMEQKEVVKAVDKKAVKEAYSCPMKCEGDKTYAKEGQCPKCNMNLKPAKG
ncbi:MAG: heavy metal-binding domain-containing protein [Flavobacteriaceae bacterium]|nr:heavy metal-binding domain-containing protein [Flavobacteriaceae bacterium]